MSKFSEILVNPYTAVRLFSRCYLSFGDTLLTNRIFKVTREAWIASMFLIAIGSHEDEWWLTPLLHSGSPDFNCYSLYRDKESNYTYRSLLKLEVFEWRNEEPDNNFIEALQELKLNQIIDPELTLLCYIRRNEVIPPALELNRILLEIAPRIKEVWYLGNTTPDGKDWRITQIYPTTTSFELDYDLVLNTKEKRSFIHTYRGKSDTLKFETTGSKVRVSPEFEISIV